MTATPINQTDIDGLAAALDGLDLPPRQRALLASIVAAAAKYADEQSLSTEDAPPSFAEQFAAAYTPGAAAFLVGHHHISRG
ncbi:hypothetical protein OG792_05830 [Micromonospora sp. NBC_01699]|uniref:hypothetical protein n=1 Tax=Micromonospora sp. NBC_01699 TaxID=2975984 RepID=UPI002E348EC0|nr:hypothetical protein [Micromonospora sp. NBC_01699]